MLWHLPAIVGQNLLALRAQVTQLEQRRRRRASGRLAALTVIGVLLLVVPLLGIGVLLWRLVETLVRLLVRVVARPASGVRPAVDSHPSPAPPASKEQTMTQLEDRAAPTPSASDFTDELMLPAAVPVPTIGWRRVVHRATGSAVNLGPGPRERHLR